MDIALARLSNQLLGSRKKKSPAEVVAWLGAVQAQDYHPARWALGLRMPQATDAGIEKAHNEGQILRTHVMRPTWHFLVPQDLRAVQALTAPRAHAGNAAMQRKLELDGKLLARCHRVLADCLAEKRIQAFGQRLAYILMHAEFEALICSGPRRGKQFTYALVEDRAPKAKALPQEEALAQLFPRPRARAAEGLRLVVRAHAAGRAAGLGAGGRQAAARNRRRQHLLAVLGHGDR
jgi:hypothetical protein